MFLGIDIGSTSSKALVLDAALQVTGKAVVNTGAGTSGPQRSVAAALETAGIGPEQIAYSVVTGYGRIVYEKADRQITEITCHARGSAHLMPEARTVIDIGGQDAKVIRLGAGGQVENFVMNEKCAAGTGRFLEVMARILDCGIDRLGPLSQGATAETVISNTCTVFAESEVISQLSAGARAENVAAGAHRAVAKRVAGLAKRIGVRPAVIMTGGVAMNSGLVSALETELGTTIRVATDSQLVGALGAALYAKSYFEDR